MKALSLLQPWASLVVMGAKQYETRTWHTFFRGRIFIHSSAKRDSYAMNLHLIEPFSKYINSFRALPFGAIIGEVVIRETESTEIVHQNLAMKSWVDEMSFGDYSQGRHAWRLTNPVQYKHPIACKGSLNLWEVPEDVLRLIRLANKVKIDV